jgi:uncharacterized protein YlxW (UPF0749 family)
MFNGFNNIMKKGSIISFVTVGVLVGVLITWQLITNAPLMNPSFPADELTARDNLISEFLTEQSYLQSRIVFLRSEIEDMEDYLNEQMEISDIQLLDNLKKGVGLTEVRGRGVEILLDDSPFASRGESKVSEVELVQAADIRDLVNVLFASNADAVAVNSQRITSSSPISSVGTTLLINNSYVAPPFTITAVGDVDLMIQRISNDSLLTSLFERSAKYKLPLQITIKEWITIPIYNGVYTANYLNLVE